MNLTKPQQLVYDAEKYIGGSIAVMCGIMTVDQVCPETQVVEAIQKIYETNFALNLKLDDSGAEPQMYYESPQSRTVSVVRVQQLSELEAIGQAAATTPFDMRGWLSELTAVIHPNGYGVIVKLHHLIGDAWSMSLIGTQLNAILEGSPCVRYSYETYINTEKEYLQGKRYERDRQFFLQAFQDCCEPVLLSDRQSGDYKAKRLRFSLSLTLRQSLLAYAEKEDSSEFACLLSAFAVLYGKLKNCASSFFLGMPVLNRMSETELNTVGMYVNIVPVPVQLDYDQPFAENLVCIQNSVFAAFKHQKFNYNDILKAIRAHCGFQGKLYDCAVNYQPDEIMARQVMRSEEYTREMQTENLQVFFHRRNREAGLVVDYVYRTAVFSAAEITRFHGAFLRVLNLLLSDDKRPLRDVSVLDEAERENVLHGFNATAVPYEQNQTVFDLFKEEAQSHPDKTAVIAADRTLTYAQLRREAGRLAKGLQKQGIGSGDLVAFCLPRNGRLLCAMLGILQAGAAYLPLDPEQPEERLAYILKDSGAKLCVTEETYETLLAAEALRESVPVKEEALCYCIYTSGSTGAPKGTLLTQRNVRNYIAASNRHMNGGVLPSDCETVLSVTTVGFDIFVTESLLPLANGKTVILANERQSQFGTDLQLLLRDHPADVMQTTPSKMHAFLQGITDAACLRQLRCIVLGGESLEPSLVEKLQTMTSAQLYNVYGPTEATVWATCAKVDSANDITIGKPLANTQIYILDKYMQPVPVGVTGELCIAGDCVGQGYLNRPELTKERLVENPFGEGQLYKTGDLAYWREDGNLIFVGRNDFQVKINGQRVELGEIEAALSAVDGIDSAAVIVKNNENDRQLLCAFYTGSALAVGDLRATLAQSLPRYMVPQVFIRLDPMPLTTSGKIDRKALDNLPVTFETEAYEAPQTAQQELLLAAAEEILKAGRIGLRDNFFDRGGDSLKCIEWISLLEHRGYTLSVKDVFASADMAALAEKMRPLQEERREEPTYPTYMPLTAAQTEIYLAQSLAPDSPVYNISYVLQVKALNVRRLQYAVDRMLERHEILRTRFETRNGDPVQTIDTAARCIVERMDGEAETFIRPFDLTQAPLMRVGYRENTVVVDLHHLIADGSSMPVFFRELNSYYMGREPAETSLPYKYFAVTQQAKKEDADFWQSQFADDVPELGLRTDLPRTAAKGFDGATLYRHLPRETEERIAAVCKAQGITPFVYYYAAFQILLEKYSGQEDLVVGTPVSGRSAGNLGTIGMFVHTLPLRCRPEGDKKIAQFFREVRALSTAAVQHSNLALSARSGKSGRPLFDVMFTYQTEEMTSLVFGDEPAELVPISLPTSKYDFDFCLYPRKAGAVLAATYNTGLYRAETLQKMMSAYVGILTQALDANRRIRDLSILDETERNRVLRDFNATAVSYDKSKSVYDLFEEQTQRDGQTAVIRAGGTTYSFKQLDADAARIDAFVRQTIGDSKQVVGILCDRSYHELAAVFGVSRGGNAYLPISPQYPAERIKAMLESSGCRLVLAQRQYAHLVGCAESLEDILTQSVPADVPAPAAKPEDTLYVIYTSGSTGTPKGAMVSNRSAVNRIQWMANRYFDASTVVMRKTPYTFDVSVWEIFGFAVSGFSLYILPPEEHYNQSSVLSHIEKGQVTDLHFVPTVFEQFLAALKNTSDAKQKLRSVRHVILSGETLAAKDVNLFRLYHDGQITVHNLYGPTECAVDVTAYTCAESETDPIPIGKPIANTQIYILDKYLQPVPVGVTGELCIAGDCVGQGYLNRPELTEEKFVENPFGEGELYKTGDLAYWREDGNLIFVGRNDFQVKINGQRVELGEIEAALSAVDGIDSAAVIVKNNENDRQLLCAFYTGSALAVGDLRATLAQSLPRYMVPQVFMHLDTMPLTTSGKIDRRVLDILPVSTQRSLTDAPPAQNETEQSICSAFSAVLGQTDISRDADFFELGGTSLQLVQLLSLPPLDVLTPSAFLTDPTPAGLAKKLDAAAKTDYTYVVPLYTSAHAQKAVVLLPYAGGDASAYTALVARAREEKCGFSLLFVDWPEEKNLPAVAQEIRLLTERMDVSFYSHCAGAVVALKLLDLLNRDQKRIGTYIAGASIPPRKQKILLNPWHFLFDGVLLRVLKHAGLSAVALEPRQTKAILRKFRNHTDEYYRYFGTKKDRTPCRTHLLISKQDPFTKNYMQAKSLWRQYVAQVDSLTLLESPTHYFQNIDTDRLLNLMQTLI